jgi:hypothetical protein
MTDPDDKKLIHDAIAYQITREDELAGKRLTWIITINGFLFAALGFVAGKDSAGTAILALLALTGIAVSLAGLMGVIAAYIQLRYLTQRWELLVVDDRQWPRPYGNKRHSFLLGIPASFLPPLILAAAWAAWAAILLWT